MKDDELLIIVKQDLENAKKAKNRINKKIVEWRKLYNADEDAVVQGRSQYISKDAKKTIHWYIPNAMKPFQSTNNMVETTPQTADDVERAKSQGILLNYQFNNEFDRFDFLHQSIFIMASEGTVIARTGWEQEEEEVIQKFVGLSQKEMQVLIQNGTDIIDVQEEFIPSLNAKSYTGSFKTKKVIVSKPTAEVIKNEDFFIDPTASSIDKADFCIQKIETTISELRKQDKEYNQNGIYTNVDKLIGDVEEEESSLGADRETKLRSYGIDDEKETSDPSRKRVTIYEYYGNIDDGSGIAQPIVCTFSGNTILRLGQNPFPDKKPPFASAPFSQQPFSFWGDALTDFISDVQHVKTAVMRTFIDLMANSTNGMKHVEKGTIDAFNVKKLREAKIGTVVEWKKLSGYHPEMKSEIPPSLLQMYELFTSEGENESGITRYNQGIDAKSLNKTATGITAIMNQSQMRIWETSSRFAENYLKPIMRKWLAYNQKWLSKELAIRVAGDDYVSIKPDDIGGKLDLQINVAISGSSEQKSQHIMQLFQTSMPLVQGGIVPQDHLGKLFSKLEELWGFKELSSELKKQIETKEQQQMQQQVQQQQMQQQGVPPQGIPTPQQGM